MMEQTELIQLAREIYEDPSALARLEDRGVTHKVVRSTDNEMGGWQVVIQFSERQMEEEEVVVVTSRWCLPEAFPFKMGFVEEGLRHKAVKLFAKELQVGDPLFDDKVYIRTSDPEACRVLLTERFQGAILCFVTQGGSLSIDGREVSIVFRTTGADDEPGDVDEQIVLVAHLMAWLDA